MPKLQACHRGREIELCGRENGFTLIALMIVVVIVGVLTAIALPSYQNYVLRTNRTAAQADLLAAAQAMEKYYSVNYTYAGAVAGTTFPNEAPTDAKVKRYDIAFTGTPDPNQYVIRATPKGAQLGDGFLEITNLGVRRWDKNGDNAIGSGEDDWSRN